MICPEDIAIIGSRALALRAPRLLLRRPVDFDFICSRETLGLWLGQNRDRMEIERIEETDRVRPKVLVHGRPNCEFEIAGPGSTGEMFLDLVRRDDGTMHTPMGMVPSLDLLFTLKHSHRHLKNSPHFWKTLADYHAMRPVARLLSQHLEFLRAREKETYGYAHPRLNQDKMGFFSGDQVRYVYDHDTVHEAMKLFDVPAYTLFQKDGAQVQVDREKFFALPKPVQLASVVEESAVLAIERSLVPFPGVMTPERAWRFAFSKVLTSITSGWWRTWAYDNALDALRLWKDRGPGYWERFQAAVGAGVVRKL